MKIIVFLLFVFAALASATLTRDCTGKDAYTCLDKDREPKKCSGYKRWHSCVCYKNGKCETKKRTTRCQECQNPDVVSIDTGDSCPRICMPWKRKA